MEYKVLLLFALYIVIYLVNSRSLKKEELEKSAASRIQARWIYSLILIFGWNLIIDAVLVLRKNDVSPWILLALGGFFLVFYTFVVFWQYRTRRK
ncbi:MAG TPA: hypothetical protein ENN72_03600 [Firmicutes bacterium]|mgnify:CR=1 FL=1|nr:hypothetical protein [Bacillota bacterium]